MIHNLLLVILKIKKANAEEYFYKVLGGWSGGYLDGDSWRMNSGIVSVTEEDDYFLFHGYSGSVYKCHKESYGLRMNNVAIYHQLKEARGDIISMMDESSDWLSVKYEV
jgi:hypothetical protein